MALIKCPECSKEISDMAKICPVCGFKLKINKQKKERTIICKECGIENQSKKKSCDKCGAPLKKIHIKQNNKFIFLVFIIAIILTGIYFLFFRLNSNEKRALTILKDYQQTFKNPDSMKVHKIIYYKITDDYYYILFDISGENSYGGTTRSIVGYDESGKCYGISDDADIDTDIYIHEPDEYSEKSWRKIMGEQVSKDWERYNKKENELNVKKIMRNLK